ncbi:MAG: MBL fold metallo-hydrolase [Candidatus Aminicenantes bacterium]|nr:MAG: MBL fold metallo-hydrolase [Candidatus Aminicenantes bacterium]
MPSLHILDVSHGNCSVLIDTNGVTVIDAGPGADLLDFLVERNISRIGILLLSHADKDHISGTIGLLFASEIRIDRVYLNSDSIKKSVLWDDLVYALYDQSKGGNLYFEPSLTPHLNGKLNQGQVEVEVLAPNQYIAAKGPGGKDRKGRKLNSNSISAVIRISYNGKSFAVLPGDLDQIGLDNLLEDVDDVHAWLAVFPHHGGKPGSGEMKSFTSLFCEAVSPEVVVFSIGDNEENFPRKEVVETIEKISPSFHMFTTKSSGILITHIEQSGNHSHKDCVGNISFHLEKYPPDLVFGR